MKITFLLIIVFIIGYLSYPAISYIFEKQQPFNNNDLVVEKISPADRIKEEQIEVYNDRVVIRLKDPEWAYFTDTNSMDPVLDAEANAIEIAPKSPDDIQVGDIISYSSSKGFIVHRVIETGYDEQGWYAITKGDNNPVADPEKVRFENVKRVVVAIIY